MPPQIVLVKDAGKVATALANEKCQRILDHLRENEDATETDLANKLKIPLSTVHYNMKTLLEAKLVQADSYSYSSRGKEVMHYRVSKNPIVIVQEENQMSFLKAVVPAAVLAAGAGIIYQLTQKSAFIANAQSSIASDTMIAPAAEESTRMMVEDGASAAIYESADALAMAAPKIAETAASAPPSMLPYFIAGVVTFLAFSLIIFGVFHFWKARKVR